MDPLFPASLALLGCQVKIWYELHLVLLLLQLVSCLKLGFQEASTRDHASSQEQEVPSENGSMNKVTPQDVPSPDLLGDLLGPLAIEGPAVPAAPVEQKARNLLSTLEATPEAAGTLALATTDDHSNSVQVLYYTY